MCKEMNHTEYTVVKNDFPNGWSETPFELLLKRLDENGFSIKATHEVAADENVMDARPRCILPPVQTGRNTAVC